MTIKICYYFLHFFSLSQSSPLFLIIDCFDQNHHVLCTLIIYTLRTTLVNNIWNVFSALLATLYLCLSTMMFKTSIFISVYTFHHKHIIVLFKVSLKLWDLPMLVFAPYIRKSNAQIYYKMHALPYKCCVHLKFMFFENARHILCSFSLLILSSVLVLYLVTTSIQPSNRAHYICFGHAFVSF